MNLKKTIVDYWRANTQAVFLVGDEGNRYIDAITDAATELTTSREEAAKKNGKKARPVRVFCHDKVAGLYMGKRPPLDGGVTAKPFAAWRMMMESDKELLPHEQILSSIGLKPEDDIIFILKDWETELFKPEDGPRLVQQIRNAIHCNRMSGTFYDDDSLTSGSRGARMIVFVSSTEKLPSTLPELKPIVVPLPDTDTLSEVANRILDDLEGTYKTTKGKAGCVTTPETRKKIIASLGGFTVQGAEDAISLAIARLKSTDDVDAVLRVIEGEKAIQIRGVPGLQYVDKETLTGIELPGYEAVIDFVNSRTKLPPEVYEKYNLKALKGLGLIGRPGLGKTVIGMLLAKILGRVLLIWNIGESKGGIVGESEKNTRRALQIAQAMGALVLVDDIDKGSLGGGQGSNYGGDGGTTGNMIQMILTAMSTGTNKAVWVYTMNRVQNVPPELLRKGRLDEVFFVEAPDPMTRERIFRSHIQRRNFTIDEAGETVLKQLCEEPTAEWTGAEIEALVQDVAFASLSNGNTNLDFKLLADRAATVTPMSKMAVYANDIKEMETAAAQFVRVGRVRTPSSPKASGGKAKRSIID